MITRAVLKKALERAGWNTAQAARDLGVSRSTVYNAMNRLGITGRGKELLPKQRLLAALERHDWNVAAVANDLKVSENGVYKAMKRHKIPPRERRISQKALIAALEEAGGDRRKAARILGVHKASVGSAMIRYGLKERQPLKRTTKRQIRAALKKHCGDRGKASRELGLNYRHFLRRMVDLGMRRPGKRGRKGCWPPSREELVTLLHEYRGDRDAVADVLWEAVGKVRALQRKYRITSDQTKASHDPGWIYIPGPASYVTGRAAESRPDLEALVSLEAFGEEPGKVELTVHGRGGPKRSRRAGMAASADPGTQWLREHGISMPLEPIPPPSIAGNAPKKRKKRKGKKEQREVALRRARYELGTWEDFLEFVRFLDSHGRPTYKQRFAFFNRDDWIEYSRRTTGEGAPETLARRFERWKANVKKLQQGMDPPALLGVTVKGKAAQDDWGLFPGLEMIREAEGPSAYAADVVVVHELAKEAKGRVEFFIRATGRGVRAPKTPESVFIRDKPIKDVFKDLEIPYTGAKVSRWAELGMPVEFKEKGTRTFTYGDTAEVFEWVQQAIAAGDILDPFRKKLPAAEARPRVQRALKALKKHRVSKTQIAKLVGITRGKLESYEKKEQLRTIPRDVVVGLEKLAKEGLPDIRRRAPKAGVPPLAEIRSAVAEAGGNLTQAERVLRKKGYTHGVTGSNLSQICKRYGIPVRTRRIIEPTKEEVLAALKEHKYRIEPTAASFGFSWQPLQRLIDKYGLRELVEAHGHGKITVHDLIDAANAGGFVTTQAAALLEIHPSHFRGLLDEHGILGWFDQEHEERVEKAKAKERKDLKAEISKAVRAEETRNELAARLGMARTHLESRVKILRLGEEYASLPYDRSFRGGRERGIAPEETERVPFWMAALRDLRARYPGRGGGRRLAKALGYGNATISNWLSGKRVPALPQIERIVSEAGHPMPDWRAALDQLVQAEGSKRAAARSLGIREIGNILSGRVNPSEKLLERILGPAFWVTARVQPETGHRPGVSMGEVPPDVAKTHLSAAIVRLLGTVRSQRELAALLGISPASVSRFMRAKTAAPPPEARDAIVALYQERFGETPEGILDPRSGRQALDRALKLFPTQTALAEELGLTRGHLSRIIRGEVTLSPRIHARLEALLADVSEPAANPPRFDVRSPAQGLRAIQHPEITKNWERSLRVKPKNKKAVLVPCAGTKPFPDAPSHKHGYMKALDGKKLDVYVVSEPLGVVPYEWSRDYPQESYDFPPAHLQGQARDLLVDRIAAWFDRVAPKYEKVYLALPAHHRRLALHALEQFDGPPTKIKDVGLGACLESGACPPGHFRPTSQAYRGFLKARANPPRGVKIRITDEDKGRFVLSAFFKGEEVGFIAVMLNAEVDGVPAAVISTIHVDEDVRRKGIATRLYEIAAEEACKRGRVLRSDEELSDEAMGFWKKQYGKGRAWWHEDPFWEDIERQGEEWFPGDYFSLPCPPPRSLSNPDEPRRRYERAAAAGDPVAARKHFLERWRREGVKFSMDGLEEYLDAFPGQTVAQISEFWGRPVRSVASVLDRLGEESRAHSDGEEVLDRLLPPGEGVSSEERRQAWRKYGPESRRRARWWAGESYKSYYLPDLLGDAGIALNRIWGRHANEYRLRQLKAAVRMIKAVIQGLEGMGLGGEAEFSREYLKDAQELIGYIETGGKWGRAQQEAIPWLSGNLRGEARRLYQVVPSGHPPLKNNPCLPCALPILGALGTGAYLLRE